MDEPPSAPNKPVKPQPKARPWLKPWVKGQSGNPGGVPKAAQPPGQAVTREIRRQLSGKGRADLQTIVKGLIAKAKGGNLTAAQMILDRLDGRPAAATTQPQPTGGPATTITETMDQQLAREFREAAQLPWHPDQRRLAGDRVPWPGSSAALPEPGESGAKDDGAPHTDDNAP